MARELAASRQFHHSGKNLRRRRHQPAVGIAESDPDFPEQREPDRQQQPERRPRIAAQPRGRRLRSHRVGSFQRGKLNTHGHSKTLLARDCKVGGCSPDEAKRNPGFFVAVGFIPDCASLHPGYGRANSSAAEPDRRSARPASLSRRPWRRRHRPAARRDPRQGWIRAGLSRCGCGSVRCAP